MMNNFEVITLTDDSSNENTFPVNSNGKNQDSDNEIKLASTSESEDEDEKAPPVKRTRRGIANLSPLSGSQEMEEVNVYSSRIEMFREERKKLPSRDALLKKFAEERELNKSPENVKKDSSEVDKRKKNDAPEILVIEELERNSPSPPPQRECTCKSSITKECDELFKSLEDAALRYKTTLSMEKLNVNRTPEVELLPCEVEREFNLKIRWKFDITVLPVKRNEQFKSIFIKLSEMYEVPKNQLLLSFGDKIIKSEDTPKSLNLKISDIVDCGVISQELSQKVDKKDLLKFKLQSKDMKKKITLSMQKTDTMSTLIEKFAAKQEIPQEKITLSFDGENLDPDSTPEDLELENDFCIDVIIHS